MNQKKFIACCSLLFSTIHICDGQEFKMDTVYIEGFIINYVNKNDLKIDHNIDMTRGYFFLDSNCYKNCKRENYKTLFKINREKQNSLYILACGGDFIALNEYYFHNTLIGKKFDENMYPSIQDYTFKDRKYFYNCSLVKVKCLKTYMGKKELARFVGIDQYVFTTEQIAVNIIQEIIKLD